jgi:hypothetical protein
MAGGVWAASPAVSEKSPDTKQLAQLIPAASFGGWNSGGLCDLPLCAGDTEGTFPTEGQTWDFETFLSHYKRSFYLGWHDPQEV